MSLNIVHVITTIARGGAETQLLILVREQVKQGHKVKVVHLKGVPELKGSFLESGAEVVDELHDAVIVKQIMLLRRLLSSKNNVSVVHAHLPQAELISAFAAPQKARFIISRHFGGQFLPSGSRVLSSTLGIIASLRASRVIAISESVKRILISNREVARPSRITRVYYGFDRDLFLSSYSASLQQRSDMTITIGTVARLAPEKNLSILIKAFAAFSMEFKNSKLVIVGTGPLEQQLKVEADKLGVLEKISFLGKRSDILDILRSLNVFVLASRFEGFGMVLLEAMSAGIRIVGAENSAIVEVLGIDGAGELFNTDSDADLKEKIKTVLNKNLGVIQNAQQQRLAIFSAVHMEKEIYQIYTEK